MNPEIVQLAAEHGARSAWLFWGWEVALEMFVGGTAGALMFFQGIKRFAPAIDKVLHRVVLGCLMLAGALLFLDLGAKPHVYRFLISWRPESVIFWGTWIFIFSLAASWAARSRALAFSAWPLTSASKASLVTTKP